MSDLEYPETDYGYLDWCTGRITRDSIHCLASMLLEGTPGSLTVSQARSLNPGVNAKEVNLLVRRMSTMGATSVQARLQPKGISNLMFGAAAPGRPLVEICSLVERFLCTPSEDLSAFMLDVRSEVTGHGASQYTALKPVKA